MKEKKCGWCEDPIQAGKYCDDDCKSLHERSLYITAPGPGEKEEKPLTLTQQAKKYQKARRQRAQEEVDNAYHGERPFHD